MPPLFQRKDDGRLRRSILDGVVEQDRHELPDGILVAAIVQSGRHAHVERMTGGRRKIAKRLRRFRERITDRKVCHLQGRGFLVHARERDKSVNELRELFGLAFRLVDPFLLPDLHLQHLQARGDDGDGRFELVRRVGDELLLPLGRLHDRRDGPARAEHNNHIHQRHAHGCGGQRHPRERHDRVHLLITVEKDGHPAVGIRMDDVVFIPRRVAEARAVAQRGSEILRRVALGHGGDMRQIRLLEIAVAIIAQHEVARGVRCLGRERTVGLLPALAAVGRKVRHRALIVADHAQHLRQLPVGGDVVRRVYRHAQQQQNARNGQRRDADEAFSQPFNHRRPPAHSPAPGWRGWSRASRCP